MQQQLSPTKYQRTDIPAIKLWSIKRGVSAPRPVFYQQMVKQPMQQVTHEIHNYHHINNPLPHNQIQHQSPIQVKNKKKKEQESQNSDYEDSDSFDGKFCYDNMSGRSYLEQTMKILCQNDEQIKMKLQQLKKNKNRMIAPINFPLELKEMQRKQEMMQQQASQFQEKQQIDIPKLKNLNFYNNYEGVKQFDNNDELNFLNSSGQQQHSNSLLQQNQNTNNIRSNNHIRNNSTQNLMQQNSQFQQQQPQSQGQNSFAGNNRRNSVNSQLYFSTQETPRRENTQENYPHSCQETDMQHYSSPQMIQYMEQMKIEANKRIQQQNQQYASPAKGPISHHQMGIHTQQSTDRFYQSNYSTQMNSFRNYDTAASNNAQSMNKSQPYNTTTRSDYKNVIQEQNGNKEQDDDEISSQKVSRRLFSEQK